MCIIVNVASECGLTDKNYEQLNYLYQRYGKSQGLRILAFPSNEFGGQEPGDNAEIIRFAQSKGTGYFESFDFLLMNYFQGLSLTCFPKSKLTEKMLILFGST